LLLGSLPSALPRLLSLLTLAIEGNSRPCTLGLLLLVWWSLLLLSTGPVEGVALALWWRRRRRRRRSLLPVSLLLLITVMRLLPVTLLTGRRWWRRRWTSLTPLRHLWSLGVVPLLLLLLLRPSGSIVTSMELCPVRLLLIRLLLIRLLLIRLLWPVPSPWLLLLTLRAAAIETLAFGRRFHCTPCPRSGLIHLSTTAGALR